MLKRADTSHDDSLDEQRVMYYNSDWQLVEEFINDDWSASDPDDEHDRRMQYIWGARYIDDIAVRREYEAEGVYGPGTLESTWYHCTDTLFSTVAILDDAANLVERVSYDAYGKARHHRMADLDGDGDVDTDDGTILRGTDWLDYGVGDLNRDGIVNASDQAIRNADVGNAEPSGQISTTDNIIGYAGYVFNAEMHGGGLYTVRYRVYSPELGRWLTRDPLGYVDGMSLYEYVMSSPSLHLDPSGLIIDYLNGTEDKEWEDMMRRNEEMLKRKIEDQRNRNVITDDEADRLVQRVELTLDNTVHQLDTIRHDIQREVVTEIVLTFIPNPATHIMRTIKIVRLVAPARRLRLRHTQLNVSPRNLVPNHNIVPPVVRRRSPGCFVAGTVVLAASGMIPIEDVQAGMDVWSYDHSNEAWELREVERTFEHEYFGDLINVTVTLDDGATEEITATGNHPFWVAEGEQLDERPDVEEFPESEGVSNPYGTGGRWIEARWLRLGDHFLTRTGKSATVTGLTIRIERVKVYNLHVAQLHQYAVSCAGVLVHNKPAFAPTYNPQKHSPDQQTLIQLVKDLKIRTRKKPLTRDEVQILKEWSDEYRILFRGPEIHPNRNFNKWHIRVGPVNHIPVSRCGL